MMGMEKSADSNEKERMQEIEISGNSETNKEQQIVSLIENETSINADRNEEVKLNSIENNNNKSPEKSIGCNNLPFAVPSPFKHILLWPEKPKERKEIQLKYLMLPVRSSARHTTTVRRRQKKN